MGNLGAGEILLILAIALLIFGPRKLSDMGKGLGEGLKNFKKGLSQDDKDDEPKPKEPPPKTAEPPPQAVEPPKTLTAARDGAGEPTSPAAVPEASDADTANVPRRDG